MKEGLKWMIKQVQVKENVWNPYQKGSLSEMINTSDKVCKCNGKKQNTGKYIGSKIAQSRCERKK